MRENSNQAIAKNSIVLYVRLAVTSIFSLFTARFSLQALGVSDFGLFSVVASFISFIGIFNTIMISTSNRFIAVAIGKNDTNKANQQFNINLVIHVIIAVVTLIIAFPLCNWYIDNYVNYDGSLNAAHVIFNMSILAAVVSFIGVPFNGLIMARERFIVFSLTDIVSCALKMGFSYLLISHFQNKLIIYGIVTAFLTAYPTVVFIIYCKKKFPGITKINIERDIKQYKDVLSFAGWVSYGAVATVGKNQGASLLVNAFFNTIMNTALGIASSVNSVIASFANNISRPIAPQITKSYAAGDNKRCIELMVMSSKYTFLMMLLVSSPFLVNSDWILNLWLGQVPEYASSFIVLLIVDALVDSINSGIYEVIFASGKIKMFQLTLSTIRIVSIFAAWVVLKSGGAAYSMYYAYIGFTIIAFFARQIVLDKTLHYDTKILIKRSYLPSLIVVALFSPCLLLKHWFPGLLSLIIAFVYLSGIIVCFGLSNKERQYMFGKLTSLLNKNK